MSNPKEETETYQMRGQRVVKENEATISMVAQMFYKKCKLHRDMDMEEFIDDLPDTVGVTVHIDEDSKWVVPAEALYDPSALIIKIPTRLYLGIAAKDKRALRIFFHELGHVSLAHKPLLHYPSSHPACREEDAEWQADYFAACILDMFLRGVRLQPVQLKLFSESPPARSISSR